MSPPLKFFFSGKRLKKNIAIYAAVSLRKKAIIETIFGQLKIFFQVEHSRNQSQTNYSSNIFSALIVITVLINPL
nr:transposase [Flavobacterium ajazii]